MISSIIAWLEHAATTFSPPLFVLIGGFIEEIIAPIPSPLVATLAGTIGAAQHMSIVGLLLLNALGTLSKTIGTIPFYYIGLTCERVAIRKFGPYMGVSEEDINRLRHYFSGKRKDDILVAFLRCIPAMPSTPISLLCGMFRTNFISYLLSTYIGFYLRNLFFLYIGYTGASTLSDLMDGVGTLETIFKVIIVLLGIGVLAWLYYRRSKQR